MLKKVFQYILFVCLFALLIVSCDSDSITRDRDVKLSFSTDTLRFDTIFTTIGSATYRFKVYNNAKDAVEISRVELRGGLQSPFRMNVDGEKGYKIDNLKLLGNDSLFVFVEVTLDPKAPNAEMLVSDSILFETNGNRQYVRLEAVGLDAVHYKTLSSSSYITLETTTFTAEKPYLISNHLYVATNEVLTIESGAKLFFRNDVALYVDGTLIVKGTTAKPVVFRGARMDNVFDGYNYDEIPGQWGTIHLLAGSKNSVIENAEIRNAIVGLWVDSVVTADKPTLVIRNSKIHNMSYVGLYARGAHVEAENSVFTNCAEFVAALTLGGKYAFNHCTFANYYVIGKEGRSKDGAAVVLNNLYVGADKKVYFRDLHSANFTNCIITGNHSSELLLINSFEKETSTKLFNYNFDHCLIQKSDTTDKTHFTNILWNKDIKFKKKKEIQTFELDTLSPAKDAGLRAYSLNLSLDIKGVNRLMDKAPDLGAYERVE